MRSAAFGCFVGFATAVSAALNPLHAQPSGFYPIAFASGSGDLWDGCVTYDIAMTTRGNRLSTDHGTLGAGFWDRNFRESTGGEATAQITFSSPVNFYVGKIIDNPHPESGMIANGTRSPEGFSLGGLSNGATFAANFATGEMRNTVATAASVYGEWETKGRSTKRADRVQTYVETTGGSRTLEVGVFSSGGGEFAAGDRIAIGVFFSAPLSDTLDCDHDGIPNQQELADGTDFQDPCSYLYGGVEVTGFAPLASLGDCDGDGESDTLEISQGADPNNPCHTVATGLLPGSVPDCDNDQIVSCELNTYLAECEDDNADSNPCAPMPYSSTLAYHSAAAANSLISHSDCDGDKIANASDDCPLERGTLDNGCTPLADPLGFKAFQAAAAATLGSSQAVLGTVAGRQASVAKARSLASSSGSAVDSIKKYWTLASLSRSSDGFYVSSVLGFDLQSTARRMTGVTLSLEFGDWDYGDLGAAKKEGGSIGIYTRVTLNSKTAINLYASQGHFKNWAENALGQTAAYDSRSRTLTASVQTAFPVLQSGIQMTQNLDVSWMEESVEGYSYSNGGGFVPATSMSLVNISAGGKLTFPVMESGHQLFVKGSVSKSVEISGGDGEQDTDVLGSFTLGFDRQVDADVTTDLSFTVSGIGGETPEVRIEDSFERRF